MTIFWWIKCVLPVRKDVFCYLWLGWCMAGTLHRLEYNYKAKILSTQISFHSQKTRDWLVIRLMRAMACPSKRRWTIVEPTPYVTSQQPPNAVLMLGQRLRRWPNIKTAFGECSVLLGWPVSAFWPDVLASFITTSRLVSHRNELHLFY